MTQTNIPPIGKFLRKLRVNTGENGKDMAARMGVSRCHLSFIERGMRVIQEKQMEKLVSEYKLPERKAEELRKAALMSLTSIKLDISDKSPIAKSTAIAFSKGLSELTDSELNEIFSIINKKNAEVA